MHGRGREPPTFLRDVRHMHCMQAVPSSEQAAVANALELNYIHMQNAAPHVATDRGLGLGFRGKGAGARV